MNDLQIFESNQFGQLRYHNDASGVTWFCGKDIAVALEYPQATISQLNNLMASVPEEWKGHRPIMTPGGTQEMLCLTEQGLYFFLGRSDKPKALPYQKWVAGEIVPSIRRHGLYATPQTVESLLADPDTAIRLFAEIKAERAKAAALETKVESDRPKVIFADAVDASPNCILIRELARYLQQNGISIGQNRLFEWLRDNGYLIKSGSDKNQPTQRAMELGLFKVKKCAIPHSDGHIEAKTTTKVTGKGQSYFVNKFLSQAAA